MLKKINGNLKTVTTEYEAKYGGPSECGVLWLHRSHPHETDPDWVPFTE